MVVYINSEEHPNQRNNPSSVELLDSLLSNSAIKQQVDLFLNDTNPKRISDHTLFVCQGEYSSVSFSKAGQIHWIGTAGATTCHIVVLHDENTVALAHIDSPKAESTINNMISSMGNEMSLYVFGGFSDEKNTSYPISSSLLRYFCLSEKRFNVEIWSTLGLNTKLNGEIPHPIVTDIAFRLEDKSIHNVTFDYRGPELELRSVLRWNSQQDFNILNEETGIIEIPYFEFELDPRYHGIASAPDNFILRNCSTSPSCEPEYFCQDMRNFFRFVATKDSNKVFGPNRLPITYEMDMDGKWVKQNNA